MSLSGCIYVEIVLSTEDCPFLTSCPSKWILLRKAISGLDLLQQTCMNSLRRALVRLVLLLVQYPYS